MNTKEKLLGLKLSKKTVTIEGLTVIVKEMNAAEGTKYEQSLYEISNGKVRYNLENARTTLIALTCYDEEDNLLFEPRDIEQVKLLPNRIAAELFSVASELNNLTSGGSVDIEGAKKN